MERPEHIVQPVPITRSTGRNHLVQTGSAQKVASRKKRAKRARKEAVAARKMRRAIVVEEVKENGEE